MISFPGIKIVSFIPGRVRLRVDKLKHNEKFAQRVEKKLADVPSITLVETKIDTGSVLIKYDRKLLKQEHNVDKLIAALNSLFPDLDTDKIKGWLT